MLSEDEIGVFLADGHIESSYEAGGQYALPAGPGETPPPVQQAILDSLAAAS